MPEEEKYSYKSDAKGISSEHACMLASNPELIQAILSAKKVARWAGIWSVQILGAMMQKSPDYKKQLSWTITCRCNGNREIFGSSSAIFGNTSTSPGS